MPHPLDGIRAKIQRAEESIQNLNREISEFILANPDPYRIVREFQNERRDYVFIAFGELAVPNRFAVLVGEILYQLRSSLDHLISALVKKEGGTPSRRHQFPICTTCEKFKEACARGLIDGVPDSAKKIIKSVQPYNTPDATTSTLHLLSEWNNTDKHRLLLVVSGALPIPHHVHVGPYKDKSSTDARIPTIIYLSPPALHRVTNDGVEVFRIGLQEAHPNFNADAKFFTQIAFENVANHGPMEVIPILAKMLQLTVETINRFEAEFR
ncbi:hypothetical protein [Candidatus Binatus sp.]|uniref:hypothetical protein n=1 Tax=Candidatus Binatus sp. TaxID=2811406 RepID=UPI003C73D99D